MWKYTSIILGFVAKKWCVMAHFWGIRLKKIVCATEVSIRRTSQSIKRFIVRSFDGSSWPAREGHVQKAIRHSFQVHMLIRRRETEKGAIFSPPLTLHASRKLSMASQAHGSNGLILLPYFFECNSLPTISLFTLQVRMTDSIGIKDGKT